MNRTSFSIALLTLTFFSTGCMTLVRGDKQKVVIDTDPTGATVVVNDKTYTTPFQGVLYRKMKYEVSISKPGYRPLAFEYMARGDGMSETSLVLPGGSAIYATDQVSGASREFGKLAVIKLTPEGSVPSTQPVRYYEWSGTLYDTDTLRQAAIDARAAAFQQHLNNVKKGK